MSNTENTITKYNFSIELSTQHTRLNYNRDVFSLVSDTKEPYDDAPFETRSFESVNVLFGGSKGTFMDLVVTDDNVAQRLVRYLSKRSMSFAMNAVIVHVLTEEA